MVSLKNKPIEYSRTYFLLIAVFCANFLARGSIFCLLFAIFAFTKMPRKIKIDGCTAWTLLLTLSAAFASYIHSGMAEAIKCVNFFLMYVIGLNGYYISKDKERYIKSLLFSVFTGYAMLVCLTYFRNLSEGYTKGRRVLINFWTGERISVTLIGLVSSVVIGYFFYAFFCQKGKKLKAIAVFAMLVVFLINERSATRTPFLLFALVVVLMWVVRLKDQRSSKAIKSVATMLMLAVAGILLIAVDAFGIRTYIESTAIFERFLKEGTDTPRTETVLEHLHYMLDHLWGGGYIEQKTAHMAHNYLQQGHDLYGIFATVALLGLSASVAHNIFALLSRKGKRDIDYLFLSLYIAMGIQALLEPVFTGYPCFLFSLLLIHGTANGYLRTKRVRI